jgi:hypothetical protein
MLILKCNEMFKTTLEFDFGVSQWVNCYVSQLRNENGR